LILTSDADDMIRLCGKRVRVVSVQVRTLLFERAVVSGAVAKLVCVVSTVCGA
jgi:hypothetical protein